jgi:hypothetical protein
MKPMLKVVQGLSMFAYLGRETFVCDFVLASGNLIVSS